MTLRPYQQQAVDAIESAWSSGVRSVCYQCPTGGGKSVIFRQIVDNHHASDKVIYVCAHRKNLVTQMSEHIERAGIRHGMIMAGKPYIRYRTQACSIQTLSTRIDKLPEPDIIIYDEGHHATANQFRRPIERWPNAKVLLVTATPRRPDGSPLSDVADTLISGPEPQWLIDQGYLSDFDYYAPPGADMDGVHIRMGEFVAKEALERVQKKAIVGSAIEHYRKYSNRLPAIAACVNIAHCESVAADFCDAGYKALAVHSKMSQTEIDNAMKGLADGSVNVLCNADLLGEGIDIPAVTTLIGLRPTNSEVIFLQHCGRVLRRAEGKDRAVILDHVGNFTRHGLPSDSRTWSLSGSSKLKEPARLKKCPACFRPVSISARTCPHCGFLWAEREDVGTRMPEEKDGRLVKIERGRWNQLVLEVARNARTYDDAVDIAGEQANDIWYRALKNA